MAAWSDKAFEDVEFPARTTLADSATVSGSTTQPAEYAPSGEFATVGASP